MAARSPVHQALGDAVREFRHGLGISQEELGLRSHTNRAYVGGIERGERNPTIEVLLRLTDALDTSLPDLFSAYGRLLTGSQTRPAPTAKPGKAPS
jgi:transcriptional regulator with XRE-family HTH domain